MANFKHTISSLLFLTILTGCGGGYVQHSNSTQPLSHSTPPSFVLSTFKATSSTTEDQRLYILTSSDSINWQMVGDGPVYTPPAGHGVVRDPSITVLPSGKYAVAYTNTMEKSFGIATSGDLLNWTWLTDVNFDCGQNATWAPEWFMDGQQQIHVFISLDCNTSSPIPDFMQIYEMHPLDSTLQSWSAPQLVIGNANNTESNIDPFMVEDPSGAFHLFIAGNEFSSSDFLDSFVQFSFPRWHPILWEGPSVIKMADRYRLFLSWDDTDGVGVDLHGIYYSDSFDGMKTWTSPVPINAPIVTEHGTVLKLN